MLIIRAVESYYMKDDQLSWELNRNILRKEEPVRTHSELPLKHPVAWWYSIAKYSFTQ